MTLRRWLLGTVAVAALTSGLFARPGTVTHRDGSTYTGEVSEDEPGTVTVKIKGIPIAIKRTDVVSIKYAEADDFPKKLATLPPNDIKGRMDLGVWALGERKYDWAIQAAEAVLKIDPNSREASDFIIMVRRQRELDRAHPAGGSAGTGGATTAPAVQANYKTLSADDINIIRQNELRDREEFRVQFNNDVRRRYADQNKQNLAAFTSRPPTEQAREILRNAPELRNDVRITSDPAALATFKTRVQPTLVQGCATAGCHSGQTGAGFVMLTNNESDAVSYTNFYILNQYVKSIEKQQIGMIERTSPERSLLIAYGLPGEDRPVKHPPVQNYRPIFRTPTDPRFQLVAKWLGELQVPSPDYSIIKYDVPKNPTAPAAGPTTEPSK
jgi:hypothetical protein